MNVKLGGMRSKKFEQISPKICRVGGIPTKPSFSHTGFGEECGRVSFLLFKICQ